MSREHSNDRDRAAAREQSDRPEKAEARPFFATAAKGTEGVLRDELRELRIPQVRADRGGVHFGGDLGHAMRACLRSRIALRVLWRVGACRAGDPNELYDGVRAIDWSRWIGADSTLAVAATVKNGRLRHSGFVAQRIKDGIVDQARDREGRRPDVDRHDPDVDVVARIVRDAAELFIDLAGGSLSQRGYRTEAGAAPLKEHLAAAILRLAGFRPGTPLLDPMCGSGTLPIEAACWAAGIAAGDGREFGFTRWRSFDDEAGAMWDREREFAATFANPVPTEVRGSDRDQRVLERARANARRAGVDIRFEHRSLHEIDPPPEGALIVINPPYDIRFAEDRYWISDLREALDRFREHRFVVITPDRELPRDVGIRPDLEHTLFNGPLECRLYGWAPAAPR